MRLGSIPPVYSPLVWRAWLHAIARLIAPKEHFPGIDKLRSVYPGRGVIGTSSGTAALQLALRLSAETTKRPRVVALPAWGCPDLGTAAIGSGFSIRLYDLCPNTLAPDLDSLARVLREGCTHVVAVHYFGWIQPLRALTQIAEEFGACVIEDAAQHAGGASLGRRAGEQTQWAVLSFGRGKGLNAAGGGALLYDGTFSPTLDLLPIPSIGTAAMTCLVAAATQIMSHPFVYGIPLRIPILRLGETVYHAPSNPMQISVVNDALLASALTHEQIELDRRREMARRYYEQLRDIPGLCFSLGDIDEAGALRFPIRLSHQPSTSCVSEGIVRSYPRLLSSYREIAKHTLPGAERLTGAGELAAGVFTLPTNSRVSHARQQRIVETVRRLRSSALGGSTSDS